MSAAGAGVPPQKGQAGPPRNTIIQTESKTPIDTEWKHAAQQVGQIRCIAKVPPKRGLGLVRDWVRDNSVQTTLLLAPPSSRQTD